MKLTSATFLGLLLGLSALWIFIGEVGVHYIYSLKWQWPQASSSRTKQQFSQPRLQRDGEQPIKPGSEEESDNGEALQILIMSDPHIMCTFDK